MDDSRIVLAHGGGGIMTRELVETVILPAMGDTAAPEILGDSAPVPGAHGLVCTTDAFVVKPLFFPGGDIGSLSVHGVVNDLAVSGAEPLALTWAMIIEEGLELDVVRRIAASAGEAARNCRVRIAAGDTKVVRRGEADGMFIVTSGIGRKMSVACPPSLAEGDAILVSGPIAEHGIAVMSRREGIGFETTIQSDSAPIWPLVKALADAGIAPAAMRDPTRGGLAACCVELAEEHGVTFLLDEAAIPLRPSTKAACEMLGLDPLGVANEGKLVACVSASEAENALAVLRSCSEGRHAAIIGRVTPRKLFPVAMRTAYGGERIVEMPYGEELPRIC